jgi:hypothetical protein
MPVYRAYGLTIDSDLVLPGLGPAAPDAPVDVRVRRRPLEMDELGSAEDGSRIGALFYDVARFLLEDGRRVTVDVRREVGEDVIEARLLGEIFAGLLRQRGLLVLHACAVARDGRAVAFVGESGWGKSTLAEAFCQRGYTLLTDDVMGVAFDTAGAPLVVPSYPQIRLREDSAAHLVPDGAGLVDISRNGPKKARPDRAVPDRPVPLHALYFLEPEYRDRAGVVEIPGRTALVALVSHTRARTLIHTNAPALLADHLRQCAALVQAVPPRGLRRRRALGDLEALMELVEGDAFGAPTS